MRSGNFTNRGAPEVSLSEAELCRSGIGEFKRVDARPSDVNHVTVHDMQVVFTCFLSFADFLVRHTGC